MNTILSIGLLLAIGYPFGWLLDRIGLPRILGYIITGIVFSPDTASLISHETVSGMRPLLEICLSFIAFEVGGALKWSRIKAHEREIMYITLLASLIPFVLISGGVFLLGTIFPGAFPFEGTSLFLMAFILGALASPTEPAATLSVIHQFKARGKVCDTILGVVALDDILGILLFSFTLSGIYFFTGGEGDITAGPLVTSLYEIGLAIIFGAFMGYMIDPASRLLKLKGEGQWFVLIFAFILFCTGISQQLHIDVLLATMVMGIVTVNKCKNWRVIFKILERYTEDLIFLLFFLLSGLHLNISTIPRATFLIALFVILRIIGKFLGANLGARMAGKDSTIRKYTGGGLLPQAGVVIGLALIVHQRSEFKEISDILLTTIMGTTIINELIGPLAVKKSLKKAGEIKDEDSSSKKRRK